MTEHWFHRVPAYPNEGTPILSLYGGPGTGKSTTAAMLFAAYKQRGLNVELAHEVAKDYTWEEAKGKLRYQPLITAKQLWSYERLNGKVDLIITDTSPLLALIHGEEKGGGTPQFYEWVVDDYRRRFMVSVYLTRNPKRPYNPHGRREDEESAKTVDTRVRKLLHNYGVDYAEFPVSVGSDTKYIEKIMEYTDKVAHLD